MEKCEEAPREAPERAYHAVVKQGIVFPQNVRAPRYCSGLVLFSKIVHTSR